MIAVDSRTKHLEFQLPSGERVFLYKLVEPISGMKVDRVFEGSIGDESAMPNAFVAVTRGTGRLLSDADELVLSVITGDQCVSDMLQSSRGIFHLSIGPELKKSVSEMFGRKRVS